MAGLKTKVSAKHEIIDKTNNNIVVAVSLTVFILVSSMFAVRALVSQSLYHGRVVDEKEKSLKVLQDNETAVDELRQSYIAFVSEPVNVIGGDSNGDGSNDGDNAKIILDSLPGEYDYPALSSSIEKILVDGGYQITSIGGSEDPAIEQTAAGLSNNSGVASTPIEIPYPFSVNTDAVAGLRLLQTLEASIRPFAIDSLIISGQESTISLDIDLKTYFQPATGLQITTKEVE